MENIDKFRQLGISQGILDIIAKHGFIEPSDIQKKTIPLVYSGKDVIGKSSTGSGKTLAFSAAIIDKLRKGQGVGALILTPTRELADQVASKIHDFSENTRLNVVEITGGVDISFQIDRLRGADIVVGTPGRILDHMERRTLNLTRVKFIVLDEADRMLDMGFIHEVESILKMCPKNRQTLLFSATISDGIDHIANRHMKEPVKVSVDDQVDPSKLYQKYYSVNTNQKFSLILHLLRLEKKGIVMVFCNTRHNVDKLAYNLYKQGINCQAIHGGLSQERRSDTLRSFSEGETLVLVCTDVAARGLDIKDVSHVYNFDIPSTADDYIHRIGRTARAGKQGVAISFVSIGDNTEFRQICKEKGIRMDKEHVPKFHYVNVEFDSNSERSSARNSKTKGEGRKGGRGRRDENRRVAREFSRGGRREGPVKRMYGTRSRKRRR